MGRFVGEKMIRQIRRDFRNLISDPSPTRKALRENERLLRNCCRSVLCAGKEFAHCPRSEEGVPFVLEETYDYCELSSYGISEDSLTRFLKNLSHRRNLSYGEIFCLIPAVEYWCIRRLARNLSCDDPEKLLSSLRILDSYDGSLLISDLSKTEEVLNRDSVYPQLDRRSKEEYRDRIRATARKTKQEERTIAVELLKKARKNEDGDKNHIGAYLRNEKKNRWYFVLLGMAVSVCAVLIYLLTKDLVSVFLSAIPLFISGKLLCDGIVSKIVKPKILPKIKITDENCPTTLLTTVAMISSEEDANKFLHRLDILSCLIRFKNVRIGLLLDFSASNQPLTSEEEKILALLSEEISVRNRISNRFFCAVRRRNAVPKESRYEAWGRKQGAMIDFSDLVLGNNNAFLLVCGDVFGATYMITLDADTEPTPESVERLIGFMEHPDHRPRVKKDRYGNFFVERGYAIAAPRIEANPETSRATPYATILSGTSGTELYHNPHFNLYQDLFGEGIFCGKGIVRIDLYRDLIGRRFCDSPILSHDLPEGEILRCANLSDTVFFDGIPSDLLSDVTRSHRWVRGDFQNIRFLFRKENPSPLFCFKIIHNLCRALFPAACFLLIMLGIFHGAKTISLGLFFLLFPLILSVSSLLSALGSREAIHPIGDTARRFIESALNVLLLPSYAHLGTDAACRGVFRMICGKKTLEWTTAASASLEPNRPVDYFYRLRWQNVGFLFLFFPKTALLGALWMVGPAIAYRISQPYVKEVAEDDLKKDLTAMWNFFSDQMNEENHWLPPDNVQQEPHSCVAHRTSPTNIGLGFLSVLGAYDLSLISKEELFYRLKKGLETAKSLPKWNGHMYNWYDTRTQKVLPPEFVSVVDCGNFAAALHTLKNGLHDMKDQVADKLAKTIEEMLECTDFSVLYDNKKHLFPIGYDVQNCRFSDSYYDLYASEARLTSFYALMKGQIPLEHWSRLARPVKKTKRSLIISGWSGTMFEYFMPHIFLPAYRKTLSGEMLKGILCEQIRYAGKDLPWGISESGYYAFDSLHNYQYRAFGLPEAALRRDVSFPKVISPYSTFLVYPWFPSASRENKKKLPRGEYGYFEAIDYRLGKDNPRMVQSFMAHHVGMSFLSGVNALQNKLFQKRFMDTEGEAFRSLLAEGIPSRVSNVFPIREHRESSERFSEMRIDKPNPNRPNVRLLSNGKLSEIVSDSGTGSLIYRGMDLLAPNEDPYDPNGVFLFVRNKGRFYGTTYAPLYREKIEYRTFFDGCGTTYYGTFPEFETRHSVTIAPDASVSVRELSLKNNQMTDNTFEYFLTLSPILCEKTKYETHPEYRDLFVTAEYDSATRTVSFCRKEDGGDLWFSVTSSAEFRFDVRRDCFGDYSALPLFDSKGICSYPIFPFLVLTGKMNVRGRGTESVRFYLSVGKTKKSTVDGIKRVSSQSFETLRHRYKQSYESFCSAFHIRSSDRLVFDDAAARILIPNVASVKFHKKGNNLPKSTLWKYGISGDYPILTLRIGENSIPRILPFLKATLLFFRAGIRIDVVLLYREAVEYQTPIRTAIDAVTSELDPKIKSLIFPLNLTSVEEYHLFQKVSRLFVSLEHERNPSESPETFRPIYKDGIGLERESIRYSLGRGGYTEDFGYVVPKNGLQPLRPWSLVLANYRFGTVLNERSLGFTFAENASENRITPRTKGYGFDLGGEKLYAVINGKRIDLLRNANATFRPWEAVYQLSVEGCIVTVSVFIPKNLSAKILRIKTEGRISSIREIVYEPTVILGKKNENSVTLMSEDGSAFFQNAYNGNLHGETAVLFGVNAETEDARLHFRPTEERCEGDFILAYGCGKNSATRLSELLRNSNRISKEQEKIRTAAECRIRIDTPDEALNCFINGFLQQQIYSSRILGRTGPYQPGGAYGFRDQLQDCTSIALFEPQYLKHQILRSCRNQFEEGDVLHWWHERPHGKVDGIRTRFSDDPFWLVYACTEYYALTGCSNFFNRNVFYLSAPPLNEDESDRYFTPNRSSVSESVYSHAMRAFRYGCKFGTHGLILFGSGDWNDGMNGIPKGGETVWGSMFALTCAERFLALTEIFGNNDDRDFVLQSAKRLRTALEKYGFYNGKYLRGYAADGTPFEAEDSMDLIPQAFAEFCRLPDAERALETAYQVLWNKEEKIISLLTPPYRPRSDGFPGSIADYPPGVRENGGQYTHGGIWFARALFEAGKTEAACEILLGINPVARNRTKNEVCQYGGEPYVLAADVYTLSDRVGCAGWTYYTGAAGWYLRTLTENLFGIRRSGDFVSIHPNLPKTWDGCEVVLRIATDQLKIRISRGPNPGLFENGNPVDSIRLDGTVHEILVIV